MFTPGIVTSSTDGYTKASNVVTSDAADQWPRDTSGKRPPRAILCLTAGNIKMDLWEGGDTITIPATAGQVLNFQPKRIYATGTTGTYAALY